MIVDTNLLLVMSINMVSISASAYQCSNKKWKLTLNVYRAKKIPQARGQHAVQSPHKTSVFK